MTTLSQIIDDGHALVFIDDDSGMIIACDKLLYKVYFQVNDTNDFEYVNSYSILKYSESEDFEEILMGAKRLADVINQNKVSL